MDKIEELLTRKPVYCCEKPKLGFALSVDRQDIEIICKTCGTSFWGWQTDCEHAVELRAEIKKCFKHNGIHEYEGRECPVCATGKANGDDEWK